MTDTQFYIFLSLAVISISLFIFNVPRRLNEIIDPQYRRAISLETELILWKQKVEELQRQLEAERAKNVLLMGEIQKLKSRVSNLEDVSDMVLLTKEKATLLVMGDSSFGLADRNALRRAGVLFHRLVDGSFANLRDELQRKRGEGRQYKVVHISSHAGKEGIQFSDGMYGGAELSEIVVGVELLFLASCSNVGLSDDIFGIVPNIVVVYEEVDTNDMESFVFEFYNALKVDFDILRSFNVAIQKVPSVAEFVDVRRVTHA